MGILPKQISSVIPENVKNPTKRLLQQLFYTAFTKVSGGKNKALLWSYAQLELSPFILYQGYLLGTYPMPNMKSGKITEWYDPEIRGIIPIQDFKLRNDLLRNLKKEKLKGIDERFEIRINTNFQGVIVGCSNPRGEKTKTWLTSEFMKVVLELHEMGVAHSIETYQNGELVGGVFGIAINGYFATLSLFHSVDNASKVAFYYLLVKLKEDGFKLHVSGDANSWFTQYGSINISKDEFRKNLVMATIAPVTFSTNVPILEF